MKKIVFAISFLVSFFAVNCFGQDKIMVREIYYQVSEDGEVNDRKTIQDRTIEFNLKRGATRISSNIHRGNSSYVPNEEIIDIRLITNRSDKATLVYDDRQFLIECMEHKDDSSSIRHYISYNNYSDPTEIRSVSENHDGTTTDLQTVTIEYFYYCDVPNLEPKDRELKIYYNYGIILSEGGCIWLRRTIKRDGVTVQHAERKYQRNN